MKGLLVKDFRILKLNKRLFFVFALYLFILIFMGGSEDVLTSISGMIIFLIGNMAATTISYDEFNKGMEYVMTLPYSRTVYVVEKYLLVVISMLVGYIFTIASTLIFLTEELAFTIIVAGGVVMVMFIVQAVSMPFYLKYGVEKGRIYALIGYGCLGLVGIIAGMYGMPLLELNNPISKSIVAILEGPAIVWMLTGFIGSFAVYIISMLISIKIMNKKEF